jgi:hypothetical protein
VGNENNSNTKIPIEEADNELKAKMLKEWGKTKLSNESPQVKEKMRASSKIALADTILDKVLEIGVGPEASLLQKRISKLDLPPEMQEDAEIVYDQDTGDYFLETEVPPLVRYNEETGKILCYDAALANLIRLATNGEPRLIKRLLGSGGTKLRIKMLSDDSGFLRTHLLSRALHESLHGETKKDPADWAKIALQIIESQRKEKELEQKGAYEPRYRRIKPADASVSELTSDLYQVVRDSEELRGKSDSEE